ncbi:hypothetical protein EAF04_009132 [Stromatinia cepivora]|nr:hypothetical protein EAF04_009132 [Stromatinia cepivora]
MSTTHHSSSDISKSPGIGCTGIFVGVPREVDDQIWSHVPAILGPRLIKIDPDLSCKGHHLHTWLTEERRFHINVMNSGEAPTNHDSKKPSTSSHILRPRAES